VIVCFVDIGGIDDHKLLPKTFHIKGYGYGAKLPLFIERV
jgi:hypothetical protein